MVEILNSDIRLTKNESFVLRALSDAKRPLSAYTILDELRDEGVRAPLQVYRALEKLVQIGIVHRVESLNAFIACNDSSCEDSTATAFVICDKCEIVQEVSDESISCFLSQLANQASIKPTKSSIELHGICNNCEKLSNNTI